jgi:hypothetical protein
MEEEVASSFEMSFIFTNLTFNISEDSAVNIMQDELKQWYSTRGTRRHLRGYVKFKISIYILFPE